MYFCPPAQRENRNQVSLKPTERVLDRDREPCRCFHTTLTAGDALDDLLDAVDGVGEVEVAHEGEREGVEKTAAARLGETVVVLGTASLLVLRPRDDAV